MEIDAVTPSDNPAWIYEKNQVPAIFEPWARKLIDLANPAPGEKVLDAACGTGVIARLVAPMVGNTGRVVGLDFDPMMLAVAREIAPEIDWQLGDLQKLPFADGHFDLVICHQGLQFLPDRAAGLSEMHRVMHSGGRLVLGVWTELAKCPGQAAIFGALGKAVGKDMSQPPPWSLADGEQLRALVASAGFKNVETTTTSLIATYPSARRFVEIIIEGSSKLTRQVFEQIPIERRAVLVDEAVERLRQYETDAGFQVPNESRLLVGYKG
jgi:SAM-dependent methyltransferase